MPQELSKEELAEYFKSIAVDGKIPHEKIAELIHDARFPDSMFAKGVEKIKEREALDKRQRELAAIVLPRMEEAKALLSQGAECLTNGDRAGYNATQAKISAILTEIEVEARELEEVSAQLNSK